MMRRLLLHLRRQPRPGQLPRLTRKTSLRRSLLRMRMMRCLTPRPTTMTKRRCVYDPIQHSSNVLAHHAVYLRSSHLTRHALPCLRCKHLMLLCVTGI